MPEAMPEVTDGELMMSNTLFVGPENREAYLSAIREILPKARGLDGCRSLEVGEVVGEPGTFLLTERWSNGDQYLHEYLQLPFYQEYLEKTEGLYSAPRTVAVLTPIS